MTKKRSKNSKKIKQVIQEKTSNSFTHEAFGNWKNANLPLSNIMGSEASSLLTLWIDTRSQLITNQPQMLDNLYTTNALIERFINMRVDDSLSSGFQIKTSELSDDEIIQLRRHMTKNGDVETIKEAVKMTSLFGGGGLLFITNGDYSKPFKEEEVENSDLVIKYVDRWEISKHGMNVDTFSDHDWDSFDKKTFTYYNNSIDRSRLFLIKGKSPTSRRKLALAGWGLSDVESIITSINTFVKSNQLIFEILDEFKVDILKIGDMTNALQTQGRDAVFSRIRDIAMNKNFNSVLAIDGADDFLSRNLTFAGIPEMLNQFRIHICGDIGVPVTRFWGLSASGFSSGQEDITAYNINLNAKIRPRILPLLERVIELRCMQLFGTIPEDLEIEFNSLEIIAPNDQESVKTQQFERLTRAFEAGHITEQQYKEACNQGDLLPITI